MTYKRVFLIVLDSLGIGEAPDAKDYNDLGAHTIGHIAEKMNLHIPHMEALGYGNIEPIKNVKTTKHPQAFYTKIQEASHGKVYYKTFPNIHRYRISKGID